MTTQVAMNPWEVAMNPVAPVLAYWGQMTVDARLMVLVKGVGKVPYEAGMLNPDGSEARPVTVVKLSLVPLPESNLQFDVTREPIASWGGEWGEITLPSLRDCGITELPALNGRFVKAEMAPTGRKWTNAAGETKEGSAFKFLSVFVDEAACRADYAQANGNGSKPATPTTSATQQPVSTPTNGNGNGSEKATAVKFLKPFVQSAVRGAGGDLDKARDTLAQLIAGQALLSRHFTVDSPEVVEALTAELTK